MEQSKPQVTEDDVCWICLEQGRTGEPLLNPCSCPRKVHKMCLARWQLHSAGKEEEKTCRFCAQPLPDWKPVLTPGHLRPATPVVSVHYNGVCYRLRVKPGPEGFDLFRKQLHRITGMPLLECMQITFQCKAPDTSQELCFKGISAFEAAMHCASISAAERLVHQHISATGSTPDSNLDGLAPSPPTFAPPSTLNCNETIGNGANQASQDRQVNVENTINNDTFSARASQGSSTAASPRRTDCIILPTDDSTNQNNPESSSGTPRKELRLTRVRDFIKSWFKD